MADSVPLFMNTPNVVPLADITPNSIKVTWNPIEAIEQTGGDPVIYYQLQWLNYET